MFVLTLSDVFGLVILSVVTTLILRKVIPTFVERMRYKKEWNNGKCKNGNELKMCGAFFGKDASDIWYTYKCDCCKETIALPIRYTPYK